MSSLWRSASVRQPLREARDLDLANGRISVGDAKTEAGIRLVDILPALRDELTSHRPAHAGAAPTDLVFPTSTRSRRDKDNARERVIRPVVAHANELLAQRRETPLPEGVSAHKLRHTFASILYVRGEDPPYVMAQRGHTDAGFTLRVYATPCAAMRATRSDSRRSSRAAIGHHWAPRWAKLRRQTLAWRAPKTTKPPRMQGLQTMGAAGFEPATSRV